MLGNRYVALGVIMRVAKIAGLMIFIALIAGAAGGGAGGATLIISEFLNLGIDTAKPLRNHLGAASIAISGASLFGTVGLIFGLFAGFLPSLVTGSLMTLLARWPLFRLRISWAFAGAAIGFAIAKYGDWQKPFSSVPAWVGGGLIAMMVYRFFVIRVFELAPVPISKRQG